YFIQTGLYLLDVNKGTLRKSMEKSMNQFLAEPMENWTKSSQPAIADNVLYYLCCSLFLMTVEEWKKWKFFFIKRILVHGIIENKNSDKSKKKSEGEEQDLTDFGISKPMLLFVSLIDGLHDELKTPTDLELGSTISHQSDEKW